MSTNCDRQRKPVTKSARSAGKYPYYGASGIGDYVSDYILDGDYPLVSEDGANLLARSTPIAFSISGKNWVNNHAHVLKFDIYELRRCVEIYLMYKTKNLKAKPLDSINHRINTIEYFMFGYEDDTDEKKFKPMVMALIITMHAIIIQ